MHCASGADIESQSTGNNTALVAAKTVEIAELLLDRGANLEAKNILGHTALTTAAAFGKYELSKLLLEAGADIRVSGMTVLGDDDDDELVESNSILVQAILNRSVELMRLYLDHGADPNGIDNGLPAIFSCVVNNFVECVQVIVEYGVDPDEVHVNGFYPLHYASFSGYLDIVKYLIDDAKADINKLTSSGSSAVSLASGRGFLDVVKYLVSKGAKVV